MKKIDLMTGDILERRNGKFEMVLDRHGLRACMCGTGGYDCLSSLMEDLRDVSFDAKHDVVRVRRPNKIWHFAIERWNEAPVIWERTKLKKVTMKQICEVFNCDEVEIEE